MVLHVKDEETDAMVRELARRRGVGITTAIREAVEEAIGRDRAKGSLWDQTADLRELLSASPKTGKAADKRFFDELSGED